MREGSRWGRACAVLFPLWSLSKERPLGDSGYGVPANYLTFIAGSMRARPISLRLVRSALSVIASIGRRGGGAARARATRCDVQLGANARASGQGQEYRHEGTDRCALAQGAGEDRCEIR